MKQMRRLLILILCGAMMTGAAACSNSVQNAGNSTESSASETTASETTISETTETTAASTEAADTRTPQTPEAEKTAAVPFREGSTANSTKASQIAGKNRIALREDKKGGEVQTEKAGALRTAVKGRQTTDGFSLDLSKAVKFSAHTIAGDAVDYSIFKDYKLTMINIWGTLCKPCIAEMPDIQKLYEKMKDRGVNVIGFIANSEADRKEKAVKILEEKGITYPNILFDDKTSQEISAQISGYPTTIFVDSQGNIVGKQLAGAKSMEVYTKEIESRLKTLE